MFNDDVRSYLTDDDRKEIAEEYFNKGIESVAKRLKAKGIPVETISSATGLSCDVITSMV